MNRMNTAENTFNETNIKPIIHYYDKDSYNTMAYVGRDLIHFPQFDINSKNIHDIKW